MPNTLSKGKILTLTLLGDFSDPKIYGELVSVDGYESMSDPFSYKLIILTKELSIIDKIKCNTPVSFKIESSINGEPKNEKFFNGIIETISFKKRNNPKDSVNPQFEYCLHLVPTFFSLNKVKHSRVFYKEKQEITKVVQQVLDEHKVKHDIQIKDSNLFTSETCIQYNESDYDFVSRLIQAMGCYYYFKHDEKEHMMIISNQVTQYHDLKNKLVQYVSDGGNVLELNDFVLNYSHYPNDFLVNAFTYAKPGETIEKSHADSPHKKQEGKLPGNEISSYICNMQNDKQAEKIAEGLGISEQLSAESIIGQSEYLEFATGGKFQLDGDFFKEFPKKNYVITKLFFHADTYRDSIYSNDFTSIPIDRLFISRDIFSKPIISGLHFAVVVNSEGKVSDSKPYSDENGNVFIKLLWGKKNDICKANVLSISNGYAIPRIGSLVYVLFPGNNLYGDNPVICGLHNQGLLNFKDEEEKYKNFYMTYPASSDKAVYNSIVLTDKKEAEAININAKKDLFLNVENDEVNVIKNDSTSNIKNIRKVILEEGNDILEVNKGDISIEAKEGKYKLTTKGDIIIESSDKINIIAKSDIGIKSGGKITMDAKDGIIIKTDGEFKSQSKKDMSLESNAAVNVSGQKTNINAKTTSNYKSGTATVIDSGTSTDIKSGTATSIKSTTSMHIEGISAALKGKTNLKISSPMTKMGM